MKNIFKVINFIIISVIIFSCSANPQRTSKDLSLKTKRTREPILTNSKESTTSRSGMFNDPPILIQPVKPEFPEEVKNSNIEGTVLMQVEVLKSGVVGRVEVISSPHELLSLSAINAVEQYKFKPAKKSGKNVAVWINLPIEFRND